MTFEPWRWRQNDLELRVHFLPAMTTRHVAVGECYQMAILWRGRCFHLFEMNGTEAN